MGRTTRTKRRIKEDLSFTIHDLTHKFGSLKDGVNSNHSMNWIVGTRPSGSISYEINTLDKYYSYIRLKYTNTNNYNKVETKMDYKIELVRKPSNLPNNKGFRWYFRCPITHKLCTILICTDKYFKSRDPKVVYYDSQAQSKSQRGMEYGYCFRITEMEDQRAKFKNNTYRSYYNNLPTKRYLKFLKLEKKVIVSSQHTYTYMQKFLAKFSQNGTSID